jgi:hypothetical protein
MKKPQYEEVPTKEIRIGVDYNDESQGLCLSGPPVSPGYDHQHFKTQKNEFKELDDGVHHHKSFVFRYASCHDFSIQELTTKKVSFLLCR